MIISMCNRALNCPFESCRYAQGEWDININGSEVVLRDSQGVVSNGTLSAPAPGESLIAWTAGHGAGQSSSVVYNLLAGQETEHATLAIGAPGTTAPAPTFDIAMQDQSYFVLALSRCQKSKPCDFGPAIPH